MGYIRCPRCELNYIDKKDKFCSVCKQEMKANGDSMYDDTETELCPICHSNLITHDQDMCDSCREELGDDMFNEETAREWRKYVNDEDDDLTEEEEEEENIGEGTSIAEIGDESLGLSSLDDDEFGEIDDEIGKEIMEEFDDSDDFDDEDDDDDFDDEDDDDDFDDEEDDDDDED